MEIFLTLLLDNIKSHNLFVRADNSSKYYVLNPDISVEYLQKKKYNIENENDIEMLYELLGGLFALCARFEIPVGIDLNHGILANILYRDNEIDNDEYILYYFQDFPESTQSILNSMATPEIIDYYGNMNDQYHLQKVSNSSKSSSGKSSSKSSKSSPKSSNPDGDEINIDNFQTYLQLLAKHRLLKQQLPNKFNTYKRLKAFISKFYIRNNLRRLNTTINQLSILLNSVAISPQYVNAWLNTDPINVTMKVDQEYGNKVTSWFIEILKDNGANFPYDEVTNVATISKQEKESIYNTFILKLFFFWTSVQNIVTSQINNINLYTSKIYNITITKTKGLPTANTCSFNLNIPYVESKSELYRKLVKAVYFVEQAVGIEGGKKSKSKNKSVSKTTSKSITKNTKK